MIHISLGISWISDCRNILTSESIPKIEKYSTASSKDWSRRVSAFLTLVIAWRSAIKIAASFFSATFFNGNIAPMRFPRCIEEPVGFTPVMIFLDIRENIMYRIYEKRKNTQNYSASESIYRRRSERISYPYWLITLSGWNWKLDISFPVTWKSGVFFHFPSETNGINEL